MWRPFPSPLKFWTPRRSTCGVRYARLSCFGRHLPDYMASVPAALPNLDATKLGRWRPLRTSSPIWTPPKLPTGVHSAHLHRFGRHPNFPLASIPHIFSNLDATKLGRRRPFCTPISIWTPYAQSHGVQFCCPSQVGRHPLNHTASVLLSFPDLDASHSITWRPILLLFSSWTPLNSDAGVHSCCSSQSGRHTHNHTASNFVDLLKLDATHSITRRPFCSASPIWTPHTQSHGVQFCCSSQVGRHSTRTPASVPAAHHNLDATCQITWRPFRTASPIWTPRQSTCGVQSTLSSPFGRLTHSPLASIPHIFSNLDASSVNMWRPIYAFIAIWTPCNIWTPCHIRIHPPISPEFRKIKQATAWLSIILENGQLPSSL